MTYNERINVALAVAMPDGGLITPVIKDADTTDIYQISRNWVRPSRCGSRCVHPVSGPSEPSVMMQQCTLSCKYGMPIFKLSGLLMIIL